MNTFRNDLYRRCECGHVRIVHQGQCYIAGCLCKHYEWHRDPPVPRVPHVKMLDSTEPKLFDLWRGVFDNLYRDA